MKFFSMANSIIIEGRFRDNLFLTEISAKALPIIYYNEFIHSLLKQRFFHASLQEGEVNSI